MPYQTREFYEEQGRLFLEGKLALEPNSDEVRNMVLKMFNNLRVGLVLDIGIGPKPLIDIELLRKGYLVVGIDIAHSFISAAKRMLKQSNLEGRFVVSEATNLPFSSSIFDVCLCSEVMEHLKKPEALLREIDRVLKPDGKLILTTPNRFSLCKAIMVLRRILKQEKSVPHPSHVKEYTYNEILRLCRKSFNLRAYYHTGGFPTSGLSFFSAPFSIIFNFIVDFPYLNKLSGTMGFILEKAYKDQIYI